MDFDQMFDDDDDSQKKGDESNPLKQAREHIKSLEKQLKASNAKAAELEEFKNSYELKQREESLTETFKAVGLNPKHAKLYLKATDGENDADAVKAFAEENELPINPPEDAPPPASTRGFKPVGDAGVPSGGKRYNTEELENLRRENPGEADAAIREGRVDTVTTIREDIARVRAEAS